MAAPDNAHRVLKGRSSSLLFRLLLAFLLLSALPLITFGVYVNYRLHLVREASQRATGTYERRAQSIAARVSD